VNGLLTENFECKVSTHERRHPSIVPKIIFCENERQDIDFDYHIYTDGSKMDCNVGSAFSVFVNNSETENGMYRIGSFCSVFQAKLIAINKSIEYIISVINNNSSDNCVKICICSDSQNALSAIKQLNNSHPIVHEIKTLIKDYQNRICFQMKWIKGHSEIIGNERADSLAKEASKLDISESIYNLFPLSFVKRHFHTISINEWEKQWLNTSKASQTKDFFPSIRDRLKIKHLKPNFVITQFLSGNGNFMSYLKRFKIRQIDLCDYEQDIETPLHIIFSCDLFINERHQLINYFHRFGQSWPTLPKNFISDKNFYKEFKCFQKV
jgi:ribonuclease HI